jgi:hypothetical protein
MQETFGGEVSARSGDLRRAFSVRGEMGQLLRERCFEGSLAAIAIPVRASLSC